MSLELGGGWSPKNAKGVRGWSWKNSEMFLEWKTGYPLTSPPLLHAASSKHGRQGSGRPLSESAMEHQGVHCRTLGSCPGQLCPTLGPRSFPHTHTLPILLGIGVGLSWVSCPELILLCSVLLHPPSPVVVVGAPSDQEWGPLELGAA